MAIEQRIAHGLFTWQDGRTALEASLRSTAGIVDEVIIADGLIQGVDPGDLPWLSDLSFLSTASYLPASVPVSGKEWRGLSAMCNFILETARERGCEWVLFVDGDQELHDGARLREWLRSWPADAFPISRVDNGRPHPCPWHCVRVGAFHRYLAGCWCLEHRRLGPVSLVPDRVAPMLPPSAPWLSHHPERRPPKRQAVTRLGQLEVKLEPPPDGVSALPVPSLLP